jgi:PAS domain S-box-containing protein
MLGFFKSLLSPDFMPHGYCYLWDPRMVWLHVISDGLITLSYYCIPVVLIYFIRKNRDLPFSRIFWMFGTFTLACGTTHLMEIWNVWHGSYLLAGVVKGFTAAVSVLTAAMLIPLVPKVISLPGRMHLQEANHELEREIGERERAEEAAKQTLDTSVAALKELADQRFALDQHAIVAVTDVQGTITYVNDKFCDISQYSKAELIGQNHRILNSGHHPKEFFQQMYRTITKGEVWHGEIKNRAKDGSIYWVDATIVPFVGADGKPRQYVAIRTDITERKVAAEVLGRQALELARQTEELARSRQALETQTLMLQSVLDSMAEGLVAADEQGKFILWNPAAERIVGLGAASVPCEEWSSHYGLFLPDTVTPFPPQQNPLLRAIHGEVCSAEMFVRNPELDEGVWIEASAGPLKDKNGVLRGGVTAFRDISQRRADEVEIRTLNDELELRVAGRTAELATANKELEAFSYSVSHDLRAPLRHIGGFSKLLVEEFGSTLDPSAKHYLDRIQAGTQKMGLLVDELLNLARVGRHAPRLQPTRLDAIIAEVIAILQPESEGREVEWVIADLPSVECDPILIKQVFQNLLANALKFTRPRADGNAQAGTRAPTRAVIEVKYTEEDGQAVFMVRDNGIGFNMKYVDKLFGVFQRLHSTQDFEGTGVGLATVQRIVQKHGGRVWAEGEPDKGAAFYFSLGGGKQAESKSSGAMAGEQS